ncbi:MAG: hypothetical protein AAFV78_08285 [Bacteroidota bacterium]
MRYTPEEILAIFQEQHRLCSPLDPLVIDPFEANDQTLVWEWIDRFDLLPHRELAEALNHKFDIAAFWKEWETVLYPDDQRTLWDVCKFISARAEKLTFEPITVFGRTCLEAGIFYTIKSELSKQGVKVDLLRPSTQLIDFFEKDRDISSLVEIMTLTGVATFGQFEYGDLQRVRRNKYWIDKFIPTFQYIIPIVCKDIGTFRDLVRRVVENKKLVATFATSE